VPTTAGAAYDRASDTWTAIADWPRPRGEPQVIWAGTQMMVWGGRESEDLFAAGDVYDPVADAWSQMSTIGEPSPRLGASTTWTGSVLCVWGGFQPGVSNLDVDGACYDPQADTWTTMSAVDRPDAFVWALPTVWTGSQMVAWGWHPYADASGMYDVAADTWLPTPVVNRPAARELHTMVWTGEEVIMWGGRTLPEDISLGDGARFTP
jgi:N-acetylneuraminic acid mutarotase